MAVNGPYLPPPADETNVRIAKLTSVVAAIVSITISLLPTNVANAGQNPCRRRTEPITVNTSISQNEPLKSLFAALAKSAGKMRLGMPLKNYLETDDTIHCMY